MSFTLWIDDNHVTNDNVMSKDDFSGDSQREKGFVAGTGASAIRVNTALRQANLVAVALMNALRVNSLTYSPQSTLATIQNAIANSDLFKLDTLFYKDGTDAVIRTNLYPQTKNTVQIGSLSKYFKDIFISGYSVDGKFGDINRSITNINSNITTINTRLSNLGFKKGDITFCGTAYAPNNVGQSTEQATQGLYRQGNYVIGKLILTNANISLPTHIRNGTLLGQIPEEFRPSSDQYVTIFMTNADNFAIGSFGYAAVLKIKTDGTYEIVDGLTDSGGPIETCKSCALNFGYEAPPITN